jgi:multidrug resistance efflux pump
LRNILINKNNYNDEELKLIKTEKNNIEMILQNEKVSFINELEKSKNDNDYHNNQLYQELQKINTEVNKKSNEHQNQINDLNKIIEEKEKEINILRVEIDEIKFKLENVIERNNALEQSC